MEESYGSRSQSEQKWANAKYCLWQLTLLLKDSIPETLNSPPPHSSWSLGG